MLSTFRKRQPLRIRARRGRGQCTRVLASESLERRRLLSTNDGDAFSSACFCSGCIPFGDDGQALMQPSMLQAAADLPASQARIAPSGDLRIDALRYTQGWIWGTSTITYSFYAGGSHYGPESSPQPVSIAVQDNVRYIFNEILQPLVNLTFVEVADTPTSYGLMRFLASTSASYAYAYAPSAGDTNTGGRIDVVGDVVLNPRNDVATGDQNALRNSFQSGPGSHGFTALIHEIGHALGLKHPFDDTPNLPRAEDNQDNTLMSYTLVGASPAMPMPYDLLALQYFYGGNLSTRADDTTYVFSAVDAFTPGSGSAGSPSAVRGRTKHTLWDAGGVDTVDLSRLPAHAAGYRVDVRPGGWITTTDAYNSVSYAGSNVVTNFGTRISLAGTDLENVVVSRSSDNIFLNGAANRVSGYAAGVTTGNDVIHGADQSDILDLSGFARSGVAESQVGDDLLLNLGVAGTITVKDYFAVPSAERMRIEYQPDASVRITADRASLRAGQTTLVTFSLGMTTTNFTVDDVTTVGGVLSGFSGQGSIYTATFTPLPNFEGTGSIAVAAGVFSGSNGTPNLAASLSLPIDTAPPTVSVARRGGGTLGVGATDVITFSFSDSVAAFTASQVEVTGGVLTGFAGTARTYTATFTPTENFRGTATIAVAAGIFADAAGNPSLASNRLEIPVDTASPTVQISRSGGGTVTMGSMPVITFTLDMPSTNFTAGDVTVTGGSLTGFAGSGTAYTATFLPATPFQGTATITVAAGVFTSAAGSPNRAGALDVPVDTVVPTLTITRSGSGPLAIGATAIISFTISEPGTTFSAAAITTTGGTLSGMSGFGTTFTATFTPTPGFEGVGSVRVAEGAFRDAVGYANVAASLNLDIDTRAPTVSLAIDGPAMLRAGDTATVTFRLSESAVNFGLASVSVTGGRLIGMQGSGSTYTATFVPTVQFRGSASIAVPGNRFTDLAGNGNQPGNVIGLDVDTISPYVVGFRASPGVAQLGIGGQVLIEAEISISVQPGGSFMVRLDSGGQAELIVDDTGRVARGTYTAQAGDFSEDLDVIVIVGNGTIRNESGNPLDETLPAVGASLAGRHSIGVDARVKFIDSGAFSTNPLFVRDVRNQYRTIPIRFTTPVSGMTVASLSLSVDGRPVPLRGAQLQGSGASYVLRIPSNRVNPIGIHKLTAVPGGIRATANGASATDQVSLYWGYQRSVGMTPDAPAWVAAERIVQTGRRTSVVINWQQPSGGAGGPVTHYLVQYRMEGTSRWLTVRSRIPSWVTSTEISGITPGRRYEFQVAAVNAAGQGSFASSGAVNLLALAGWQIPTAIKGRRA